MSSPTFFPEGSSPRLGDPMWRIAQKILGATLDGGGGGGGGAGVNPLTVAAGAPSGAPSVLQPFYWDSTNSLLYLWDGTSWNIH